MGLYLSK